MPDPDAARDGLHRLDLAAEPWRRAERGAQDLRQPGAVDHDQIAVAVTEFGDIGPCQPAPGGIPDSAFGRRQRLFPDSCPDADRVETT